MLISAFLCFVLINNMLHYYTFYLSLLGLSMIGFVIANSIQYKMEKISSLRFIFEIDGYVLSLMIIFWYITTY